MHIEIERKKRKLVGLDLERKEEVVGLGLGTTQVGAGELDNEKRRSRQNIASRVSVEKRATTGTIGEKRRERGE